MHESGVKYGWRWVRRAWTNALPAIDWKGRTSVLRAFVLFCAATLTVWALPWEQTPVLGSGPTPSPSANVRAFLSAMIATVGLFGIAFAYQLLVTPARMHRDLENERNDVRRDLDKRDKFIRTVVETEETTEKLINLHAEGKRLYFDASDLDGWNYRMENWEKQVEYLIENRLSLGELHYFRNMENMYGFRKVSDAPEEWNDKMERKLYHYTGVLDRLNEIIPHMRHVHMKAIFEYGKRQRSDDEL